MSAVVSVEARLYADGCMELQYDRVPGQEHRSAAKIGIETRSGQLDLQKAPHAEGIRSDACFYQIIFCWNLLQSSPQSLR